MGLLVQLVKDLIISADPPLFGGKRLLGKDLRAFFDPDPQGVLAAYSLGKDEFAAMVEMSRNAIICTIEDEIGELEEGGVSVAPWDLSDDLAASNLLLRLVADFVSETEPSPRLIGPALRVAFNSDPKSVTDKYNLSKEAAAAIKNKDLDDVMCILAEELDDWEFPVGEFPPSTPDCAPTGVVAMYPDPDPFLYAASFSGGTLIVKGQGFVAGHTHILLKGSSGGSDIDIPKDQITLSGTFRCGELTVTSLAPSSGEYLVTVKVGKDGKYAEIPSHSLKITV